jgi:hypothetical protein
MKEFINKINIYSYFGKGGVQKFKKEFGIEIYKNILKYTSVLDNTYYSNRKFTARLVFIKKYNNDINNITKNNKLLYFRNNDFEYTVKNSAKKGWDDTLLTLNKINELYDYKKTYYLLENNFNKYIGKSGNRKLIKEDPILFKSIYYHTNFLNNLNKNFNKLIHRIYFIINKINDTVCEKCDKNKTWKYEKNVFTIRCYHCEPKFPEKRWFILKYGDNGILKYDQYFDKVKKNKSNSLEWYINKYGEKGKLLYQKRYQEQNIKINILKNNRFSKISQELFNEIKKELNDHTDLYYNDYNGEYFIKLPLDNELNQTIIFVDFKYKNKIIEYHGEYWHDINNDILRKNLIENLGYEYLSIYSNEYNRNKKNKITIDKCLNFLKNDFK